MTATVLVTGATGFIGRAVVAGLHRAGLSVIAGSRSGRPIAGADRSLVLPDLAGDGDIVDALRPVDVVVHLAAHVHQMDASPDAADRYRRINTDGTRRLADQAAAAGVDRFVLLSSIKVLGDETAPDRPFTDRTAPAPTDAYGRSKRDAEDALVAVAAATALVPVVLRPPLVYGAGVKANFKALVRLCDSPWPLPLGAVRDNRRSLIHVDNLADAIRLACCDAALGGHRLLVADDTCLSTAALCARLRQALGRPARLVPVPPPLLAAAFRALGRGAAADRLLGSLAVEPGDLRRRFGWTPPIGVDAAMARTVETGATHP